MSVITDKERALMREVSADPIAASLLTHKCRWEGMSRYAVLKEWGDPRKWPSYVKEALLRPGSPKGSGADQKGGTE